MNPRNLRTVNSDMKLQDEDKTPDWAIDINCHLEEGHTFDAGKSWTIYRVPNNFHQVRESAFDPKIISVGPFHCKESSLQAMEEHKMRYLVRLLGGKFEKEGGSGLDGEELPRKTVKLEDLVKSMKLLEQKTRACYSENFNNIKSDEFVHMMVTDGCFVVEILRQYYKHVKHEEAKLKETVDDPSRQKKTVDDPIFETRWMLRTLQRDLLMLENQLPFFVLEELFKLTSTDQEETSLPVLAVTFFNPLLPREDIAAKLDKEEEYDHLLDVFRSTFLSAVRKKVKAHGWSGSSHNLSMPAIASQDRNLILDVFLTTFLSAVQACTRRGTHGSFSSSHSSASQDRQLNHCAIEVQEAGVEIQKQENCDLLDISYNDGVLKIPPLPINDDTVPLFFNFIAFEQCDDAARPFFTNFFMFLDSLIYSKLDVQILHREAIINHALGSNKAVAILINTLARQIVYDPSQCYLSAEMKKVNHRCKVYYESKLRTWWRNLVRKYFSNPWSILSLAAAILLLILTVVQTFYTIYPVYK
ncbi:UPF0481 protein At3g47200-like isoform X2 [Punica granatum]|uniref:UPF0481 protein At3g47200-like isoform X2 n=1 Tax=Punica granatum TaxID=22663 RepID=A0A6P8CGL1_PUNGR|nr:UPF0481 protein At3g47200-like isoform X2 [Punica granatum]